jgi:FkbM family methyltransferase
MTVPVPMALPAVALALLRDVVAAQSGAELSHNVDPMRFPPGLEEPPRADAAERLAELLHLAPDLELLYERLEHDADRDLMVRVLAFRVLGHRWVQLPMTRDRLQALIVRAEAARTAARTASFGIFDWMADDYDLNGLGYPIALRGYIGSVVQTFALEQYRYTGTPQIAVRPGDTVIDGGAHWGDTALYLAQLAGEQGRVVSFEFEPSNLDAFHYNLSINPELARRIEVVAAALWDQGGTQVSVSPQGPGTAIRLDGEASAPTDTIDALVAREDVDRVDFIKLDIEGAELNALRGAHATLRRFRPRLAIAAYHKPDDLAVIPGYLDALQLGYRFRLGHATMHGEETVLFATADASSVTEVAS